MFNKKLQPFSLFTIQRVRNKRRRSKQIKKKPSSSNGQRLVVNVFSKEFNTSLATKYKHCLVKLVSSEGDVEELCNDLNANAVAPENSSLNRSQIANSSNHKSPKKEQPAINESDHDINIELDSEYIKTSIARCDESLDEVKSRKVRLDDANLSQRRRLSQTCKNKNQSKSKHQQFKSEHSSLTTLKLRKASYADLDGKLKSELNDAESARMCTQSKTAHETSVKVEPTAELVLQNKTVRPRRQTRQTRPSKRHCPVCVNCTSETTSHGAGSKNTSPANNRNDSSNKTKLETTYKRRNNRNRKEATHDNTVPAVNAKLEDKSFKTQSLTDTSANARWCLQNRTVFEINEELEAKLLIEEKLKSDLGNMVFERFCCLNRPDRDASLLEYWNEQVKKEMWRLSKLVSPKKLSLYMKLALAERLSSNSSFNNSERVEDDEQKIRRVCFA